MRELPILFSGPMVKAILDGRKTMTRRICKDIVGYDFKWGLDREPYIGNYKMFAKTESGKWDWITLENQWLYDLQTAVDDSKTYLLKCPWQISDRLWVRETLKRIEWTDGIDGVAYVADGEPAWDISRPCRWMWKNKTLPSMFMPQGLARIWLEVTDVRVERLQEITATDALKEGISEPYACRSESGYEFEMRMGFKELWDSLNAKRGYPFEMSPWVWVIEFRRLQKIAIALG